ncbi:BCCT family transporter [Rothia dentocariosa]|uniref:BCCT family transporter n=1 Tax=Rothia dentocariosa TaxID=2047 RepID=UPI003A887B41
MKSRKYTSVFIGSLIISLILVALGFVPGYEAVSKNLRALIGTDFGWFYLLLVTLIVLVCGFFVLSPMGQIKLGEPDSKPEYSTGSWIAMLFSAGMGIGLVFYGAAEPLSHFANKTPHAAPGSQQAMADSFQFTFFHWGIHAWAVYGIVAMALAYFGFRKEEKYLLSVTLKPLFGKKTDGWLGYIIDIVTVVATVIGVATTLGFGAIQINGGLSYLTDNAIPNSMEVRTVIIVVTTALFVLSALSGLGKGIKILSNLNMILAIALLAIAIAVGPTVKIFDNMSESIGLYMQNFFEMSFRTAAFNGDERAWIDTWTIFYWAWWISWSPFVGLFIARISKGRSIREFITVVLLIPTVLSFIWFSAFGTMANTVQQNGLENLTKLEDEQLLFGTFKHYPLGMLMSIIAIILIFTFFITSADSATYVLSMLSEDGRLIPTNGKKVVWGVIVAGIATVLLYAGGLDALRNTLIIIALPFAVVIALIVVALIVEVYHEKVQMGLSISPKRYPEKGQPFKSYEPYEVEDSEDDQISEEKSEAKVVQKES